MIKRRESQANFSVISPVEFQLPRVKMVTFKRKFQLADDVGVECE